MIAGGQQHPVVDLAEQRRARRSRAARGAARSSDRRPSSARPVLRQCAGIQLFQDFDRAVRQRSGRGARASRRLRGPLGTLDAGERKLGRIDLDDADAVGHAGHAKVRRILANAIGLHGAEVRRDHGHDGGAACTAGELADGASVCGVEKTWASSSGVRSVAGSARSGAASACWASAFASAFGCVGGVRRGGRAVRLPLANAREKQVTDLAQRTVRFLRRLFRHVILPARSVHFDDVVQLAELVRLDVLVVRIGHPLAVDDEAIAISARRQRQLPSSTRRGRPLVTIGVRIGDQLLKSPAISTFFASSNRAAKMTSSPICLTP